MRSLYEAFPHARRVNREKGFTLIELLVVIAIIAILAAIAIPQFARYRMRAYNGAAESDLRNMATAEEALYADNQIYGTSEVASSLNNLTGANGQGQVVSGPMSPATPTQQGAAIAGQIDINGDGTPDQAVGVGYGVSRGVDTRADTESGGYASYIIVAHHDQGNTAYAKDSDSTAIYRCTNDTFINNPTPPAGSFPSGLNIPASQVGIDDLNGQNCGGSPIGTWIAQ